MTTKSNTPDRDVFAAKEAARAADRSIIARGMRTAEEVDRRNAAFAFTPSQARINLAASTRLV